MNKLILMRRCNMKYGELLIENFDFEKYWWRHDLLWEIKYIIEELDDNTISEKRKIDLYDELQSYDKDILKEAGYKIPLPTIKNFPQISTRKNSDTLIGLSNDDLKIDWSAKLKEKDYYLGKYVFTFSKYIFKIMEDDTIENAELNTFLMRSDECLKRFEYIKNDMISDKQRYLEFVEITGVQIKYLRNSDVAYFITEFSSYDELLNFLKTVRKLNFPITSYCNHGVNWFFSLWKFTRYIKSEMREKGLIK